MMGRWVVAMLLLFPCAVATTIGSANELFAAITSAAITNEPARSVGFISQGNYQAVSSILPKSAADGGPLVVKFFSDLASLEAAVVDGTIIAGLTTSRPTNADGHLQEFPASLVTMRAPMFAIPKSTQPQLNSQQLREAFDAAIVRTIENRAYQKLESKYWKSNKFDSVSAFTCGIDSTKFPFPSAQNASGLLARVISSKKLKVGALGPSNWGYQGNYQVANATGFWPDYMRAIMVEFAKAYPGVEMVRVWNTTSNAVMDGVENGVTDLTEPYWTVSAWYRGRARSEHFELGCTVLGTESIFFTKSKFFGMTNTTLSKSDSSSSDLAVWAIVLIAVSCGVALVLLALVCVMVQKEKEGTPMFMPVPDQPQQDEPVVNSANVKVEITTGNPPSVPPSKK